MTKEDILKEFLSGDSHKIWSASGMVIKSVITDRDVIEALVPYLDEIKKATRNIDYGGAFRPNQRYINKALTVIEKSKGKECLCEYAFTDYGQSVDSLKNFGFVILSEEKDGFVVRGEVECPKCRQRYIAEEEFTGWHMTSSRHWKAE